MTTPDGRRGWPVQLSAQAGVVLLAAGLAAARPWLAAMLGPAVVTLVAAWLDGAPRPRTAVSVVAGLAFGLAAYWGAGAVLGAGYPEVRAFRDTAGFAVLVTVAAAVLARIDRQGEPGSSF